MRAPIAVLDAQPVITATARESGQVSSSEQRHARGDFRAADEIRRELADRGITVQETEGETRWKPSPPAYV
jgi:cysteinyl-tRNA synthetase